MSSSSPSGYRAALQPRYRRVGELVDEFAGRLLKLFGEPPSRDRVSRAADDRGDQHHRSRAHLAVADERAYPVLERAPEIAVERGDGRTSRRFPVQFPARVTDPLPAGCLPAPANLGLK